MGKHETGYARVERDDYPSPPWVVDALDEHVKLRGLTIWEMACGREGRMSEALKAAGCTRVYSTNIVNGYAGQDAVWDFLSEQVPPDLPRCDGGVTNPPFGKRGKAAEAFIARCVQLLESGFINFAALLLPQDFDSAKTRAHLFGDCSYFVGKITLRRRVKWFEHPDLPARSPKENSAWFLWARSPLNVSHQPIILLYAPNPTSTETDLSQRRSRGRHRIRLGAEP